MNDCDYVSLKLLNAIRSWACVNPDCSRIGTCRTAPNPLKVDLPAAWLQGISPRMSRQEKPLAWPEGPERVLLTQRPHSLSVPDEMALSLQRASWAQTKCTELLLLSLNENVGWLNITQMVLNALKPFGKVGQISMHLQQRSIWNIDVNMCLQINFRAYLALGPGTLIWCEPPLLEGKRATVANMCKLYSIDRVSLVSTCQCAPAMSMTCPISR